MNHKIKTGARAPSEAEVILDQGNRIKELMKANAACIEKLERLGGILHKTGALYRSDESIGAIIEILKGEQA